MDYRYSLHGHAIAVASSPEGKTTCQATCGQCATRCCDTQDQGTRHVWGTAYRGQADTAAWYYIPCPIPPAAGKGVLAVSAVQLLLDMEGECYIDKVFILSNSRRILFQETDVLVAGNYHKTFTLPLGIDGAFSIYLRCSFKGLATVNFRGSDIGLLIGSIPLVSEAR